MSLVKSHPSIITPLQLRAELARQGYVESDRTLREWRKRGLFPRLVTRGRGRGLGKVQFWRSQNVIEQGLTVCELHRLKYPNDEARLILWLSGFKLDPSFVRSAWVSRLGKLEVYLRSNKERAIKKRGNQFLDIEDELSALVEKDVIKISTHFRLDRRSIIQPVIDLFGLVFRSKFLPDTILQDGLIELVENKSAASVSKHARFSGWQFTAILKFMRAYMSFAAVDEIILSATKSELIQAHRYWRRILRLSRELLPKTITSGHFSRVLASGFGKLCVPAIIRLMREGKSSEIDLSIREISKFLIKHVGVFSRLVAVVRGGELPQPEKVELAFLVRKLAKIWDHCGFPFSLAESR